MHAIVAFLAMGLAAPAVAAAEAASTSSTLAWIIGLGCGVALMGALKFDWRNLPRDVLTLVRRQRLDMQWGAFAVVCLGVIILY
jgi:hypothetical protein